MMEPTTPYANNVFEQPWWLDVVARGQWHEVIVEENGEVIGRLPYVLHKKWWGDAIEMPRLTPNLGIWFKENTNNAGNLQLSNQKRIINELLSQLPKRRFFKIRIYHKNRYVLPFIWAGYHLKPAFTYRIEELNDCQAIYNNFHKTAKKNINSAKKKVTVRDDLSIEVLLKLLDITFLAQNRTNPMSKEFIREIVSACEKHDAGKFMAAEDSDGNIHTCAYFIYDNNACYYLFAGSDPKFKSSGSQSLIIWEGIQFAAQHSKVFDFEGSTVESIENFFRQFGGICTMYYEVRKIPLVFELFDFIKPKIKKLLKYK